VVIIVTTNPYQEARQIMKPKLCIYSTDFPEMLLLSPLSKINKYSDNPIIFPQPVTQHPKPSYDSDFFNISNCPQLCGNMMSKIRLDIGIFSRPVNSQTRGLLQQRSLLSSASLYSVLSTFSAGNTQLCFSVLFLVSWYLVGGAKLHG